MREKNIKILDLEKKREIKHLEDLGIDGII
jgi:hypothetical protein